MINAIIVDDEKHCINNLTDLLNESCSQSVNLVGAFESVEEGIAGIKRLHPDLVLLDVQIHDKTGFDLLIQLPEINFDVIFTTAYEDHAARAFRFSALDYLLKPIDPDQLVVAIGKLNKKLSQEDISKKFDTLFHNLKNLPGSSKRITIPTRDELHLIYIRDIIRCEAKGNYTNIHLTDKKTILVSTTLKEYEELLTAYNFCRVHNSNLINLAYVKTYNKGIGGSATMTDGSEIEISTRKKDEFLKRLAEM